MKAGKVTENYELDLDYKQEKADSNVVLDAHKEDKGENSNAEYVKMELLAKGLLDSGGLTIKCKIRFGLYMQHEDLR